MKRFLFIIVALYCLAFTSYSQNDTLYGFYYANNTRHYWVEDHTSLNIIVNNLNHYDSIVARLGRIFNAPLDQIWADNEDNNIIVNSSSLLTRNITDIISAISLSSNDIAFTSFAKRINGKSIWLNNEAYVKLKNNSFFTTHIQPVLLQYPNVVSYYEGNNEYRFVCPTDSMVVTLSNKLYDTVYTVFSSPDFYSTGNLSTNDPYFDNQWNLKNTGQNNGVIGVDIKAEEAWSFVQKVIGAPGGNIKVAVIDDGVEEHEDFYEGGGVSVILEGYTANGDGIGRPRPKNKHGECCAGIVAAVHNDKGLAGVAPHSRIVPIRIFKNSNQELLFSRRKIARAITKSWEDYYADVLSCSWICTEPDDFINNAINRASTDGRNGKGCVVVFSSGNNSNSNVSYPSCLEKVLSVGSIDQNGHKATYSDYGNELDIVAPGQDIITTDRMGDYGYCNNQTPEPNYKTDFGGTSAACPHVSGVVALMLSVNPNLSREQVFSILESTAQKVGGYNYNNSNNHPNGTWNQYSGYGLVDAHKAVAESFLYGQNLYVEGPDSFSWNPCVEYVYSLNIPHPEYFTFNWSCSSNLSILSTNQNTISIIVNGNGTGYVIVEVYSEGRLIGRYSKDIVVTTNYYSMGSAPINITSNTNWNSNNYAVLNEVVVEPGATLTITGTVYCSKKGCFKVKPQGCLIIDGGHLTNLCSNEMWPGIEVWGNTNTHQYAVNGSYGQGYLELKNGAVIENAICAVDLWRPDYWSTTGGIINASDASFLNNTMAVHALCYRNFKPLNNNEADYNAVFNNCEFVVDRSYLGKETFKKHINIADVRGVRFNGCDFSADRSVTGVDPWCLGINAYDASFVVKAVCNNSNVSPCPANDYHQSTFSGFCAAVRAGSNGNHPRGFTVRETLFANNDYGVYATNTDFPLILQNEFTIGGEDYCRYNYGVYLKDVASFCIEENEFSPSLMAAGITYGIAIYDSQGINDVYLNQFTNLTCGNLAKGSNTGQANGSTVPGLTYSCNTNTGNDNDFVVLQDHGNGGIQPQQGSSTMPAGNTFGASDWQFYNGGTHTIDYYNNSTNTGETPSSSHLYHVTTHGTTSGNYCHPHYGNDPVEKSSAEKAALASDYFSAHNAYLATQMSEYAHEYTLAAGDIVRSNLNESEADPAELREWLGKMNDITADRMVVSSYIHEGDSSSAFALAKTLPNKYGLYGDDLADHADYLRLMQLYQTLYRTNRTVYQLADSEKGMVDDIANNGTGISKSLAETLIEQITGNQRGDCIDSELPSPPNSNRGELSVQKTFVNNGEGFRINIIPNPASTWAVVDYKLPADKTEAVVEIYNSLGAKVMSVELVGSQGQRVLDFRHLPGGVYTYNLRSGEFVKTGKIVITTVH